VALEEVIHPQPEDRLIVFCSAPFHNGIPIQLTEAKFDFWSRIASGLSIEGFKFTDFYRETPVINGKPTRQSLNRILKKRGGLLLEEVVIHSIFKCSCVLHYEAKMTNVTRAIGQTIWKQIHDYGGGNLYANLKDVILHTCST
jgi:hypothetical protein